MGQKRQRDGGNNHSGGGTNKQRWHDHSRGGGVALPYGKQGILVTIESSDPRRATKEAISVLEEAWEELTQDAQQQGPEAAATATAAEPQPAEPKDTQDEAGEEGDTKNKAAEGQGNAEESKPPAPANASEQEEAAAGEDGEEGSAPADFSSLISSEVKNLKDKKKRPFVGHDTGIKTCLFIHMPLVSESTPGPNEVVKHIVKRAADTKVLRFRHCARFLPCTHICKPEMEDISKTAAAAVASALDCSKDAESKSVAVLYEHRAAPKGLERMKVIDEVIAHVPRPPHTIKLKGASKTISVQVVRNACGIAVVDDYHELARYNVKEVCKDKEKDGKKGSDAQTMARSS